MILPPTSRGSASPRLPCLPEFTEVGSTAVGCCAAPVVHNEVGLQFIVGVGGAVCRFGPQSSTGVAMSPLPLYLSTNGSTILEEMILCYNAAGGGRVGAKNDATSFGALGLTIFIFVLL